MALQSIIYTLNFLWKGFIRQKWILIVTKISYISQAKEKQEFVSILTWVGLFKIDQVNVE